MESVPSFQDIDSSTTDSPDEDEEDTLVQAAEAAFTDDKVEEMIHHLRERGLFAFIHQYVQLESIPIKLLLLPFGVMLPAHVTEISDQLRILKMACSRVLRNREKLDQYNSVEDAIQLIGKSKNIVVLTGAGVSTSCGIPDFRSATGLYARLKDENWDLEDPQEMFDLTFFKEKPEVFYSFAKEIYPSNFIPSPCHRFVRLLEINNRLLRNYTQNIDGLFESVGVQAMLNCHGSFATASCLVCKAQFPGSAIEADVFAQRVPLCPLCTAASELREASIAPKKVMQKWSEKDNDPDEDLVGSKWFGQPIIKPDIVFFGENLSDEFDRRLLEDREKVDLIIVIGTSLRVSPVSQLVAHLPHSVPQILINRDAISHVNFDIVLLGDADVIVQHICSSLGGEWDLAQVATSPQHEPTVKTEGTKRQEPVEYERIGDSFVTLFPGAVGGPWVDAVRQAYGEESENGEEDGEEQEEEDLGRERGVDGLKVPEASESRSRSRSAESSERVDTDDDRKRIKL